MDPPLRAPKPVTMLRRLVKQKQIPPSTHEMIDAIKPDKAD
jgi:hypothetical protein